MSQEFRVGGQEDRSWLILVYRMQSKPTRLRAAVWRRLKTLGAVYLQSGAAAVPYSAASERALLQLHHDIHAAAGSSMVLQCKVLAGEADAISAFNAARANEYVMVIGKGQGLVQRIEQEHQAERFSVAGPRR